MSVLSLDESAKNQDYISEIWETKTVWEFKEPTAKDKAVIDGKAIIGIIEGQFFVPDGKSRNERFYPKNLWENVLGSKPIKEKLENLLMFGMIGHEDKAITEEDLRKGDVSHIIANLWIDENNQGMGKAYILNTDAGKNLYIYLKAGAKLKTSSRARGKFVESEKKDGLPIVDTDSFYLETFDFVINPGFEETSATLMEKLLKEKNMKGDAVVQEQINETVKFLTESSEKLQSQLKTSITEVANLKIEKEELKAENKKLADKTTSVSFLENVDKSIIEALSEFDENDWNAILNSKIKITGALRESSYVHNTVSYDAVFIPVKASKVPLNKFESVVKNTMNEWESNNVPVDTVFVKKKDNNLFGSNGLLILWKQGQRPMNATESVSKLVIEGNHDLFEGYGVPLTKAFTREQENQLNKDLAELNKYRAIGSVSEVSKAIESSTELLKEYQKLGTPSDINEAIDKLSSEVNTYREIGSIDEVNVVVDLVAQYSELGNPEELSEGIDKLANTIKEYQELGSIDEVNSLITVVTDYQKLGTPTEVSEGLDKLANTIKEYQELGSIDEVNSLVGLVEKYLEIGTPTEINEGLDKLTAEITSYRELGTISEVESLLSVVENYATGDAKELMDKYMRIGTPEDINTVLEESKEVVSQYVEIGPIDEINSALDKVEETLAKYAELGSYDDISEALEKSQAIIESYVTLGTPEEISEALDVIIDFSNEVGKPSEIAESIEKANTVLGQYKSLGTPEEITSALTKAMEIVESVSKTKSTPSSEVKKSVVVSEQVKEKESTRSSDRIFKSFNESTESMKSENIEVSTEEVSEVSESVDGNVEVRNIFKSNDNGTFVKPKNESGSEDNSPKTRTNTLLENISRFNEGSRAIGIFKNMSN